MARRIARSSTAEQVKQAIEQRPEGVGIRLTASVVSDSKRQITNHGVALEPPISAFDLAEALKLRNPEVHTFTHVGSRWELMVRRWTVAWGRTLFPFRKRLVHPRLGKWCVKSTLDDQPTGKWLEGGYALGESDVIRYVFFTSDEP